MRGTDETGVDTTHGIRQGCAVSCFLFGVVFNVPLRHLDVAHLSFLAFVDDITLVVPKGMMPRTAATVQSVVGKIGCQLNVKKSDCLPVHDCCSPPSLLVYHHPEPAVSVKGRGPMAAMK